jgi:hypothetical protein
VAVAMAPSVDDEQNEQDEKQDEQDNHPRFIVPELPRAPDKLV